MCTQSLSEQVLMVDVHLITNTGLTVATVWYAIVRVHITEC
jgi:hypothetical protein